MVNGTVTDNMTGLMWEKKDNSSGIHDMDNIYTWSLQALPRMERSSRTL